MVALTTPAGAPLAPDGPAECPADREGARAGRGPLPPPRRRPPPRLDPAPATPISVERAEVRGHQRGCAYPRSGQPGPSKLGPFSYWLKLARASSRLGRILNSLLSLVMTNTSKICGLMFASRS